MSVPSGEDLYQRLCLAAVRAGKSVSAFSQPLFKDGSKLAQLRNSRRPKPHTIERIEALIEGRPVPPPLYPVNHDRLLPSQLSMTRLQAEAMGLPRSGRSKTDSRALEMALERRRHVDHMRNLSDLARETRRPGQALGERLRELTREIAA